jgi:hypothetical protein
MESLLPCKPDTRPSFGACLKNTKTKIKQEYDSAVMLTWFCSFAAQTEKANGTVAAAVVGRDAANYVSVVLAQRTRDHVSAVVALEPHGTGATAVRCSNTAASNTAVQARRARNNDIAANTAVPHVTCTGATACYTAGCAMVGAASDCTCYTGFPGTASRRYAAILAFKPCSALASAVIVGNTAANNTAVQARCARYNFFAAVAFKPGLATAAVIGRDTTKTGAAVLA